jgi:hypothetical protein
MRIDRADIALRHLHCIIRGEAKNRTSFCDSLLNLSTAHRWIVELRVLAAFKLAHTRNCIQSHDGGEGH